MNNPLQMIQMVNQIKNNPMSILSQFDIPQNLSNNPQDIIQHLLNNGQISQDQYNNAIKQAQNMGFKI